MSCSEDTGPHLSMQQENWMEQYQPNKGNLLEIIAPYMKQTEGCDKTLWSGNQLKRINGQEKITY